MKEIIRYFYNINVDEYSEKNDSYIFRNDVKVYIFKRNKNRIEDLENICNICRNYRLNIHKVIINKDNKISTIFNGNEYILLEVCSNNKIVEKKHFNLNSRITIPYILEDNWSKKVDYYAKQIFEFGIENKELVKLANYYIGMAENAITLYNEALEEGDYQCSIQHRRIYYPNYAINYFDPTELVIDCRVRDFAEFYKSKFFYDQVSIEEILYDIDNNNFSASEIKLFVARMLYPTYFFDLFEKNIIRENNDQKLLKEFIEKNSSYLSLLNNLEIKISQKFNLNLIYWIKKEL